MHIRTENRDGFALPVALLAMVIIGAIVTGGFYASSQESRISTSTELASEAFYVAEYGLEQMLGTLTNGELVAIHDSIDGDDDLFTVRLADSVEVTTGGQTLGWYDVEVRPIGAYVYLLTSRGLVHQGGRAAERSVGSMVRVTEAQMPYPSALSVFGGLTASGNSQIRGEDVAGPGCSPGDTVAGVTAVDESLVDEGSKDRISGLPPIAVDPDLDTARLSDFGTVQLEDLMASATKVYEDANAKEKGMAPAVTTDSLGSETCDITLSNNWGDPDRSGACADYMPIIHAKGDLSLQTGKGQGILIVEGDLRATGNFDFYGVVIVLGTLFTSGTGNHFEGSVIVQGAGQLDSESTTTGNSLVQYSSCRVRDAFNASLLPRRLESRSWIDFTAVTRGTT